MGDGLGYTFTNLTTSTVSSGLVPLPVNTYFGTPDVCLMQRNDYWYALVAYTNGFPSFGYLMILKFDIIAQVWTHVSTTQFGIVLSTINIYSDQHEHFFVVWDENLNPNIVVKGAAGAFNAAMNTVVVCMTNYQFPQFKDANGNLVQYPYLRPDVSVMDLPISNNNPGQVKITFLGGQCLSEPTAVQSLCISQDMKFDKYGMCVYTPMPDVLQYISFALPAYWCQFENPRIARNRRNGNFNNVQEGFTVVYEKQNYLNNPSSFDIAGVTCFYDYATNFPNPNPIITFKENTYTNGSSEFYLSQTQKFLPKINSNANLSQFLIINHNPVVSYERKSGSTDPNDLQIMCIAFVHHLSSTQKIVASFYAHNSNGRPYTRDVGYVPNYQFYRVSTAINDNTHAISVSGELSEKFMYSFANETQFTICHKEVLSFEHLKHGHFVSNNNGLPISSEMLYDNFTPMFFNEIAGNVVWIDIQGKLLCNNVADLSATKERIGPGISFLSFLNKHGLAQKVKLIKL